MKFIVITMVCAFFFSDGWHTNFKEALQTAQKEERPILLNFSGSDWCGPCIRLRSEIFDSKAFSAMADTSLVLVNADFPRYRKNKLPAPLQEQNDALASRYNPSGKFPLTLLLDTAGNILKQWEGFPGATAEAFTREVKNDADAYLHQ